MQENFGGEFLIFIVISFWGLNFRLKRKLEKIFQLYMVQEVALLIQGQLLEIAVDTSESTPLTQKRAIAVGRLSRQKGFDMLVEAWALIEKEVPDWKLDIYGQGPLQKELQGQIDGLGLRNIELKGFSDDIHKEYMESSLFFLSSRYEGFVLVLMEAMATGLPAVSFRCKEGPEETIDNGINGYLVEEGNVQQFADCAIKLMKNETLLKQFASKTKKDLDRFNTAAIINQWVELLRNM